MDLVSLLFDSNIIAYKSLNFQFSDVHFLTMYGEQIVYFSSKSIATNSNVVGWSSSMSASGSAVSSMVIRETKEDTT